ncbi:hypothetical protein EON63_02015 [archaeon]|nr:MAG: hypothetical protein EON63_02015 [archaeon]
MHIHILHIHSHIYLGLDACLLASGSAYCTSLPAHRGDTYKAWHDHHIICCVVYGYGYMVAYIH